MHGRGVSTLVVVAALAASTAVVGGASPASASTSVTVNLACQTNAGAAGTVLTSQTAGFDVNAPSFRHIGENAVIDMAPPVGNVATTQQGINVNSVQDLSFKFPVPAGSSFAGATLAGGFNYGSGTPTIALQGTNIFYAIPGPIPAGQDFQLPAVHLTLHTTGNAGTKIDLKLGGTSYGDPGFTTTANTSLGSFPTNCYPVAPNPSIALIPIVAPDTQGPSIVLATPAAGAMFPQGVHVVASYACDDGTYGSGVATCVGTLANGATIDTSALGSYSFTVTATDVVGNPQTSVTHNYQVVAAGNDHTPPTITLNAPADGAIYYLDSANAANFGCADSGAGIASCTGDAASGANVDTAAVGPHSFAVHAVDNEGNTHTVTHGYRVLAAPAQQNFTSGDLTNAIPVKCNGLQSVAHDTVPIAGNVGPAQVEQSGDFTWSVTFGQDTIPTLQNGTNLVYTFAKPGQGHFTAASLTNAGSMVDGSTIQIAADGTLQLAIASVTDQSAAITGTGVDNFTPPSFRATIHADGALNAVVQNQFAQFQETLSMYGAIVCPAGEATYNGRTNPVLTRTTVIDAAPPSINVVSPTQGALVTPGAMLVAHYMCADNVAVATCAGDKPDGASLPTATSTAAVFHTNATDAAGNVAATSVSYTIDDPSATVSNASATEGPGAQLDFLVTLSNPSSRSVQLGYTTQDGSATAPADYTGAGGNLSFIPGTTSAHVLVHVVDDTTFEAATENMTLELVSAVHAKLGGASVGHGIINDNDSPPADVTNPTEAEGPGASLDFAVTLEAQPNATATYHYATFDGNAHAPADYTAVSGNLVWTPGDGLTRHVAVPITNDSVYRLPRSLQLVVTDSNGTVVSGTGTIYDDEGRTPTVNISSATIAEGDAGNRTAMLTVTLDRPSQTKTVINWATVADTAHVKTDFIAKTGKVQIAPNLASQTLAVPIVGDTVAESTEQFFVQVTVPPNMLAGITKGVVTILDDDSPTASDTTLTVSDATGVEGSTKTTAMMFTVSLNRRPSSPVTVHYATQYGTAGGTDFQAIAGTLTFSASQLTKQVRVVVIADHSGESDETFTFNVSSPTGPVRVIDASGLGTILNDD